MVGISGISGVPCDTITTISLTRQLILGQSTPERDVLTKLYIVPSPPPPACTEEIRMISSVVRSLIVCNRSETPATFRIGIQESFEGSELSIGGGMYLGTDIYPQHVTNFDSHHDYTMIDPVYIVYDKKIAGKETIPVGFDITLKERDVIYIYSSSNCLSFSAFGSETVDYTKVNEII